MGTRGIKTTRSQPRPNLALGQVRAACGMSKLAFARLLGVSDSYIQAIEVGQRPASVDFAEKVRDRTGAWTRCIVEAWAQAVDVNGHPYTAATYRQLQADGAAALASAKPRQDSSLTLGEAATGTAAGISKSSLVLSIVRDKLQEAAEHIVLLEGEGERQILPGALAGKLTLGDLRRHPALAALVGFHDDGIRGDDQIILLHHAQTPAKLAGGSLKISASAGAVTDSLVKPGGKAAARSSHGKRNTGGKK